MTTNKFLSIIVPLYNEESRILNLITIYKYLNSKKFDWDIILVNDGSIDNTKKEIKKIIRSLATKNIRLISYPKNRGKGFAIKTGMLNSSSKYSLFTDIDLSTPIEEFNKFLPYLYKYDVIIGSRKRAGSKVIIHQPNLREKLGKGFTRLSQIVLQLNVTDFTCGFKCFSKVAVNKIFNQQRVDRWGFDSEILFLAKKFNMKVKEIPVKWLNDSGSKVKFPQDIIQTLWDLCKIRINELDKQYD